MQYKYDNNKKDEHINFINHLINKKKNGEVINIEEINNYLDDVISTKEKIEKDVQKDISENNIVKNISSLKDNIIEYKDNININDIKENTKNVIDDVQKVFNNIEIKNVFSGLFGKKDKKTVNSSEELKEEKKVITPKKEKEEKKVVTPKKEKEIKS